MAFHPDENINVSSTDLRLLVKTAFALSSPQGLGLLHHSREALSEAEVDAIFERSGRPELREVEMDYVRGRAVKLTVIRHDDKFYIQHTWYDHSDLQLESLLAACGIDIQSIAAARLAASNRIDAQAASGVAFLESRGGIVSIDIRAGEDIPEENNLWSAESRGLATRFVKDGVYTFALTAPLAPQED